MIEQDFIRRDSSSHTVSNYIEKWSIDSLNITISNKASYLSITHLHGKIMSSRIWFLNSHNTKHMNYFPHGISI